MPVPVSRFVKSYKYNLWGKHEVEEVTGKFYKFTPKVTRCGVEVIYIPEEDINQVEGFSVAGGRRNLRKTKKQRKNSYRYSRHN